ncbi:unnamed protein product [Camellia sinensis]
MVVNVILQKMSGTATTSILISSPKEYLVRRRRSRDRGGGGGLFLFPNHQAILSLRSSSAISQTQTFLLTYPPYAPHKTHHNHNTTSTSIFTPLFKPPFLMKWQDCKVKMDIEVPTSVAYDCYSDRQAIPCWMPFISSVEYYYKGLFTEVEPEYKAQWRWQPKDFMVYILISGGVSEKVLQNTRDALRILEDKPDLSRWSLKYKAFGRDIEFSWLARNMHPSQIRKSSGDLLKVSPTEGKKMKGILGFVISELSLKFSQNKWFVCGVMSGGFMLQFYLFPQKLDVGQSFELRSALTVSYEVPQLLVPLASVSTPTHCKWHVEQLSLNRNEKGNGYDGMAETIMFIFLIFQLY